MRKLLSFFLILSILLCGCASLPAKEGPPQRVAVLLSSFAEVYQLAGGEVTITVGESVERGICKEGVLLADRGAGKTIDAERLLSYHPDLVIGSADIPAQIEAAKILEKAGIPCKLFRVECFEDYLTLLAYCTEITGNKDAYQKYGTDLQTEISSILKSTEDKEQKKILFIRAGSGASSVKAKTAEQHFAARMLEDLGASNIADKAPILTDGLSLEEILLQNPDRIFISTMGDEAAAKTYMEHLFSQPAWQALTAVQNKKYTYLSKDLFQYKPNARWDEAYGMLAKLLYE